MSANSALVKFNMVNGLIGSILEENNISLRSLFHKLPQIDTDTKSKIEKLLDSRDRIRDKIDAEHFNDFVDDLNLANYFLACREFDKSLRYYESALAKNHQSYSALCNKGLCLFKMSRLDEAISCYDEVLRIYKNIPVAFFIKGKILFAKQNFTGAITQFHRVLELESENIDAQYYLGKSLVRTGNIGDAVKTLESIIARNNHVDSLLLLGQIFLKEKEYQKSIVYLDKLLDLFPNHIEAHLLIGKSLIAINNISEAMSHFENILSRSPNHIEAHLLLGKTNMEIENTNNAITHFEKILEISPNHILASNLKIELLEKMGNIDDAIEYCEHLVESLPNPTEHILKKGILLFNNNKPGEALAVFNEILGTSKMNNLALLYKAKIFDQKQEYQEALLCLDAVLKSDPQNIDALKSATELSSKVGNFNDALSHLTHLLSISPSESLLERKSSLLSILGRHEESGQICMGILGHDKTNLTALGELGKIHLLLNNFEKSIDCFDRILKKKPLDAKTIFKKSLAYLSQQKFDMAILCLEQIPETDSIYNYAQYKKSTIQMIQGNTKQSIEILSKVIKSNEIFKFLATNEIIFESISDTFEFKELIK